ncbi:MAG TPA: hypothetical protein VNK95_18210, partial [Caldilineaceae bacterium]|nr:hypothetical protein [Caldilineaceae bacterium]
MRVLLFWDARRRSALEQTVTLLSNHFDFDLDVLDTTRGRQYPHLPTVAPERVQWLHATGALEFDVERACAGRS